MRFPEHAVSSKMFKFLIENTFLGGGSPFVYEEKMADAAGSFDVKAEIRNGGLGFNGGSSNGYLTLTISHNCGVSISFIV